MPNLRNIARLCTAIVIINGSIAFGAEVPATPATSMLYLCDGDYLRGQLADSSVQNMISWQTPDANTPFEFNSDAIRGAYFASSAERLAPTGDYCFELTDGDILYASLAGVSADEFELDSIQFGHLKIKRNEVRRFTAMKASAFEYRGPNGLEEWSSDAKTQWRDEAGRLVTTTRGASVRKEIAIPQKAHFEFEISWGKSPQFALAFCSGAAKAQLEEGFRLEVWGQKLVLVRELKKDADVAVIATLDRNTDRVHLEATYDFATGEFAVQSLEGKTLAHVTLPKKGGNPLHYVWLINGGDQVCLEQLTVSNWNGQSTPQIESGKPRIQKTDGTFIYGQLVQLDADKRQFVIEADGKELRLDCADVVCAVLVPEEPSAPSAIRIGLSDGTRLTGSLVKVEAGNLTLQRRGIEQPLECAINKLRSVIGLSKETRSLPTTKQRMGLWEAEGVLSHGSLTTAAATSDEKSACLVWKPKYGSNEAALRPNCSGRIVYREAPQPSKPNDADQLRRGRRVVAQPQQVGIVGGLLRTFGGDFPTPAAQQANGAGTLCLVTGDRIPCREMRIDDEGVHFTSSVVKSQLAPHEAVKALEFVPHWTDIGLAEEKRNRLLTLPRMQKSNPPTHLIVSTSGDFLRARLVSMNADSLALEVRLEEKQITRGRVGCVIWLHNEKELPSASATEPDASPTTMLVQAVQANGVRLTFTPQEFNGTALIGTSSVLGDCRVNVNDVDQFLLGKSIQKSAEKQLYGEWKLSDAVEPQFTHESENDGGAGQPPKSESALVAKPAPDFQLDLLSGGQFKLSEHKGSVVVLDFWASWCGPCMQAMPQTDAVVEEFKDRKVQLVAVNMQEGKPAINGALERLKIQPAVAIDVDGAAAERYQVSAIPQVVVIDPESRVAEVLIGANPGFADQLRDAINKALAPKDAAPKP